MSVESGEAAAPKLAEDVLVAEFEPAQAVEDVTSLHEAAVVEDSPQVLLNATDDHVNADQQGGVTPEQESHDPLDPVCDAQVALDGAASQASAAAAAPAGARNKKKKRGKSTAAGVAAADAAELPTETVIEAHGMEEAAVATAVPVVLEEDNGVLQQEVEVPSEVVPPAAKAVSDNAPTKATSAETTTPVEASPSPSVRARREQLAAATASPPAQPAPPAGSVTPVTRAAGGGGSPAPQLSDHDSVNTVNVAEVLRAGGFRLAPGRDVLPYEQLVRLRLEDGIDATRKEEYLSETEFASVFGVERGAYAQLPQWKRLQLKRSVQLF